MPRETYFVATDLSQHSLAAYRAALGLAARTGARIRLFCAAPVALAEGRTGALARFETLVEQFAEREARPGVDVDCTVVVSRDAATSIVVHAAAERATLLAVGPSGISGWRRLVLGSVTDRVLRTAPMSVLVARGASGRRVEHVVAALDRTPHSAGALRAAIAIAGRHGARLTAMHAIESPDELFPADGAGAAGSSAPERELRHFRTWVGRFPDRGVALDTIVLAGPPAQAVARAAATAEGCLVVVGTGEHSRAHKVLFGSVACAIATHCPASVLVVREEPAVRRTPRSVLSLAAR